MTATDPSRHLLVSCRSCQLVWSIAALPMVLHHTAQLMRRAQCPSCDAGTDKLFMASEEQAQAWARQQDGLE